MKKILIVCQHYYPETFRMTDTADYFINKGYEVDVLCGIPNYPTGVFFNGYSIFKKRREVHNCVNIYRAIEIPRGRKNSFIGISLNFISFPFFAMFELPKFIIKKYDNILIYQLSPVFMTLPAILLAKIKRVKTTMCILDLWPDNLLSVIKIKNKIALKLLNILSNWHYKNVDKIACLTQSARLEIINRTNKNPNDVTVIPQCCEKFYEEEMHDEKLFNKFSGKFNIVFTGSINPTQDFETMLLAAKNIQEEGIVDINWIIVGDGISQKWLIEEVERLGLKNFFFEGFIQAIEIAKYYTISDVLISCWVKHDVIKLAVPAKFMSYMACGKPVLVAMIGDANAIVKETDCGFACDSSDYKSLAENIKKIYFMTNEERLNMGKRAKEYHFKYLERNITLDKLEKFMAS